MAITYTASYPYLTPTLESHGSQRKCVSILVLTGTYDTGGFVVTPNTMGLNCGPDQVKDVMMSLCNQIVTGDTVCGGAWDPATQKFKLNASIGEMVNGTTLTGLVLELIAHC